MTLLLLLLLRRLLVLQRRPLLGPRLVLLVLVLGLH
jgi:hypothetical protein